ncbi:hypothetical protein MLD38_024971 [Melastoma candidum]|uniref:Uncharacterized protein n=1 Tax=Melastoma candidum TaxID=119954 RepID=A0ACB9NUV9_9MYRT|nr:hypothetical protein MLD38_024971 [Melastoma candidum]
MASRGFANDRRSRTTLSVYITVGLCGFFYILGAWQRSGFGKGDRIAVEITERADCSVISNLKYESHQGVDIGMSDYSTFQVRQFKPCDDRYTDYTPCHDETRALMFPRDNMIYRERHCPPEEEKLRCLIPAPRGYLNPFPWPKSRDYVPFVNVPYKRLTVEKAVQNWVHFEGNVFRFPGGGTQFPNGADAYIEELASVIPLDNGMVRTALDIGCGVASLGAYLFKKNVIAMSFSPRDSHEAQVQFALERGVPAVIGVLGTMKLPYPSGAFDMVHCSHCLIPWEYNDGMYMMEVDRVLRPGGYWVISGPPINWRDNYQAWQRPQEELEAQQRKIEEIARFLCWEKKYENREIAIWKKRTNYDSCWDQHQLPTYCKPSYSDDHWYKKMEACVTPYPETTDPNEVTGGAWKPFPERLNDVPFRILSGSVPGVSADTYHEDNRSWRKHLKAYKTINKYIGSRRYRNLLDMNAGLGSFTAAIESPNQWVMNVVPTIAEKDTLGAIYERGLIGIYHDWCEAFSTYPRTYDLIHAHGLFTLYKNRCEVEDLLLEMDRILRPEGVVIIRDDSSILYKIQRIVKGMRWDTRIVDNEDGPLFSEKVMFAVKQYWVAEGDNSLS